MKDYFDFTFRLPLLSMKESLKIGSKDGHHTVFDPLRKQAVSLTPEELVRQLLIQWLIQVAGIGPGRMVSERGLRNLFPELRYDLAIFGKDSGIKLLCECKSFKIPLNWSAIDQLARYNIALPSKYLLWTNGKETLIAVKNDSSGQYHFMEGTDENLQSMVNHLESD